MIAYDTQPRFEETGPGGFPCIRHLGPRRRRKRMSPFLYARSVETTVATLEPGSGSTGVPRENRLYRHDHEERGMMCVLELPARATPRTSRDAKALRWSGDGKTENSRRQPRSGRLGPTRGWRHLLKVVPLNICLGQGMSRQEEMASSQSSFWYTIRA